MVDHTLRIIHHLKIIKKNDWLTGKVTTDKAFDWQSNHRKVYTLITWKTNF